MRIGHTDFGISAIARLARELKRDDASDISLQRKHLQIKHQSRVVGVGSRDAHWPIEIAQWMIHRISFGLLNAAFDFANCFEILTDSRAISRAEISFKPAEIIVKRIKKA